MAREIPREATLNVCTTPGTSAGPISSSAMTTPSATGRCHCGTRTGTEVDNAAHSLHVDEIQDSSEVLAEYVGIEIENATRAAAVVGSLMWRVLVVLRSVVAMAHDSTVDTKCANGIASCV